MDPRFEEVDVTAGETGDNATACLVRKYGRELGSSDWYFQDDLYLVNECDQGVGIYFCYEEEAGEHYQCGMDAERYYTITRWVEPGGNWGLNTVLTTVYVACRADQQSDTFDPEGFDSTESTAMRRRGGGQSGLVQPSVESVVGRD